MQIFARDDSGLVITARSARAGIDYTCLECGKIVRLRAGQQRMRHFYHQRRLIGCRQSGKSLSHLRTQERLKELIPNAQLEHPFPTISRIADVYWPETNLIFEVQCSPIDAEEVAARNADYVKLGLTVVWILHDRRFNRRHITAAEHLLHDQPPYFTNIDKRGNGYFYDQRKIARQGTVLHRLRRLKVRLDRPLPDGGFEGDASCFPDYLAQLELPRRRLPSFRWLLAPYRIIFRIFLEKAC